MMALQMVDRDPNRINEHVKCHFEDVLAEPQGAHSAGCVWRSSASCFSLCQRCCYVLHSTLFAVCLAAYWGVQAASLAFCHVWLATPSLRILEITCGCAKKFLGLCVHCCLDPVCEGCALLFHVFRRGEERPDDSPRRSESLDMQG